MFNGDNELLLQQRSPTKPLWPNYWSNTCCSHPRRGEAMERPCRAGSCRSSASTARSNFSTSSSTRRSIGAVGAEHEFCWVYYGRYDGAVDVNVNEIADWRFVGVEALERELEVAPETFTPWFKMEWVHIRANYLDGMLASTGTDG